MCYVMLLCVLLYYIDPSFNDTLSFFVNDHCQSISHLSSSSDHSVQDTLLHEQYCSMIEGIFMQHLTAALPNFSLQTFAALIQHYHERRADDSEDYNEVAESIGHTH